MSKVKVSLELLEGLRAPNNSDIVHREECTQCFDNQVSSIRILLITSLIST